MHDLTVVIGPSGLFVIGGFGGWRWQALACVEGVLVASGSVWLLARAQRSFDWTGPLATRSARKHQPRGQHAT